MQAYTALRFFEKDRSLSVCHLAKGPPAQRLPRPPLGLLLLGSSVRYLCTCRGFLGSTDFVRISMPPTVKHVFAARPTSITRVVLSGESLSSSSLVFWRSSAERQTRAPFSVGCCRFPVCRVSFCVGEDLRDSYTRPSVMEGPRLQPGPDCLDAHARHLCQLDRNDHLWAVPGNDLTQSALRQLTSEVSPTRSAWPSTLHALTSPSWTSPDAVPDPDYFFQQ